MTEMWAYIDETGDPGGSHNSSEIFGMAAVLVDEAGASECQALAADLRREFNIPEGIPLSWKKHVRKHDQRKYVAKRLSQLENTKVLYVYCKKSEVSRGNFTKDRGLFYNYIAGKMHKSILWAARNTGCSASALTVRYGHMRGFDHKTTTLSYFEEVIHREASVPDYLIKSTTWVSATSFAESQIADLFAGCLNAAISKDSFGAHEGAYIRTIWSLIRNSNECAVPLGLMSVPQSHLVASHEWFPCNNCRHARV